MMTETGKQREALPVTINGPMQEKFSTDPKQRNATPYVNLAGEVSDDDDDELNSDDHAELQRNTDMNDAQEDYNVRQKLDEANKALAEEESDQDQREPKVVFKKKLIDIEVPPDNTSSSSEDESDAKEMTERIQDLSMHSQPDDETVEISGQFLRKDEKVLVEIGGHFHVVEAGELERNLPERSLQHDEKNKVILPPVKHHLKSSCPQPASNNLHHRMPPKPASAAPSLSQQSKATPTFSYPEATKKMIRKQMELKAKQKKEEEKRKKEEESLARLEAEEAWKSWLEKKNREIRHQKIHDYQMRKRQEHANRKDPDEIEEAYNSWMRQKMTQIKKERIVIQQQLIERDEGWYLRDRKDCNRAFRVWLRNKNEVAKKARADGVRLRRQSVREMRKSRKAQKLMQRIRESEQMKYVDYYGYRM